MTVALVSKHLSPEVQHTLKTIMDEAVKNQNPADLSDSIRNKEFFNNFKDLMMVRFLLE